MVIIMQRSIVVLLVSIHLCSHYYYLAIIMVSFSSINHGTMLHISLLSRRSIAAASSSIAYDEGSASMASRRPFCNNNMESLGCQYGLPRLWGHPHLLSHKTFGRERTNGGIQPPCIRDILTSILRYFSGQTDTTEMKYGMYCGVYSLETMHYGLETMHNSMCSRRNTHGWIDLVEGNPTRYCTLLHGTNVLTEIRRPSSAAMLCVI